MFISSALSLAEPGPWLVSLETAGKKGDEVVVECSSATRGSYSEKDTLLGSS